MKIQRLRLLLLAAAGALGLLLLVGAALWLLVDVDSFRPAIEARAEEILGRDVRLGEIGLSFFPLGVRAADVGIAALPAEGGGDLIAARSLRVGARALALIRGRLEVTQVVLEAPSVTLERAADGSWNLERLIPAHGGGGGAEGSGAPSPPVRVDRLRIVDGAITLRDASAPGPVRELPIRALELSITDLALDREFEVQLGAEVAGARVAVRGRAGPILPPPDGAARLDAALEVEGMDPAAIAALARSGAGIEIPGGLLGQRPVSLDLSLEAKLPADRSAAAEIAVRNLAVRGLDLTLRRGRDGRWNFDPLLARPPGRAAGPSGPPPRLEMGAASLAGARVRVVDEKAGLDAALEDLSASVDRLPASGPARVEIAGSLAVAGERAAGLAIRGSLGPLGREGEPTPLDLLVELQQARVEILGAPLREALGVGLTSGTLDVAAKVVGSTPDALEVSGTLDLAGAEAVVPAPQGEARTVPLDVSSFYDVALAEGGARLEFRSLDLNVQGTELSLTGTVDRSGPLTQIDARLQPARLMADDLAGLLALAAYEPPVAFDSRQPIEIEAHVRGPLGGDDYPQIDGRLALQGFSFRHPSMRQPLEEVGATVTLRGETVEITGFSARVGDSDIGGSLTSRGFATPRLRFDLRSRRADFWELISFVEGGGGSAPAARPAAEAGAGFLGGVVAEGTLRIDEGSFRTLDFTELDSGLRLEGQVITLDPFSMRLYGGTFRGSAALDLREEPPAFRVRSDVQAVDVDRMLADNLDLGGLLSGKFHGNLEARGAGAGPQPIVRGLQGSGSILVTEGRVGKLDVLEMLTRATGVFGEETLRSLSSKLQEEGTPFDRLSGSLKIDGGRVRSPDLVLQSPDLELRGKAGLDLLAATIDGEIQVLLSPAISRSMQAEGSRAAKAFWDAGRDQVVLPLTVSGPVSGPTPNVDWGGAAERVARRELEEQARRRLGDLGGLLGGGEAGQAAKSSLAPPGGAAEAPGGPQEEAGELAAEISRVRWGGSFLLKDLKLQGAVRGRNLSHASLVVAEAGGREIQRFDRLPEVDIYFGQGVDRAAPASITWDATVDGKKLLGGGPYLVILTVYDTGGGSAQARTEARR